MNSQAYNTINFYETQQDIGAIEPYTTITSDELYLIIKRLVTSATLIATHPNIAKKFGESSLAPIKLATDLRTAIKVAEQNGVHPNLVFPNSQLRTAMDFALTRISPSLEAELQKMLAKETEKWEEDYHSKVSSGQTRVHHRDRASKQGT